MPLNPALVAATAQDILNCACTAMVQGNRWPSGCCGGDGARAFIAEGDVSWDSCCGDCGQLSVRLVQMFESDAPPARAIGPDPDGLRRVVAEWEILRIKCAAPIVEPPGWPTAASLTASGTGLLTDLWTLWTGVRCCFNAWAQEVTEVRAGWMLTGIEMPPQGGCAGVRLGVQTDLGPSCDCFAFTPPPEP